MHLILTNHARMRAQERGISFEEILETIESPDTVQEQDDHVLCFKKRKSAFLLLVYAKDAEGNFVVITVLRTSKLKKY